MAYMNQEKKKEIADLLKSKLKGKDIKYSLGVKHHSTIVMNIQGGGVDFIGNYNEVDNNGKELENGFEATVLKRTLGAEYKHYKALNNIKHLKGIQARMPYQFTIE